MDSYNAGIQYLNSKQGYTKANASKELPALPTHERENITLLVKQYYFANCVRYELQAALEQLGIESEA